ncbi:MAG: OmpH family outer membrane protein [Candidatus Omnitrophica bacterium]|nr:OmpH family outer membrane protein [Candidatus Omnitrophota bacterium]
MKTPVRLNTWMMSWSIRALLVGTCLLSPVSCPVLKAAELKIGYVNLVRVFEEYQRTKDTEQVLEQRGKQKLSELEGRLGELKKMRQNLELLNDQAKEAKSKELEEKSDEFQRLKTKSERESVRDRNQVAKQIFDEIDGAVTAYARANGFSLVLDQRSLIVGDDVYDLTDEVLKSLNDRYAAGGKKGS